MHDDARDVWWLWPGQLWSVRVVSGRTLLTIVAVEDHGILCWSDGQDEIEGLEWLSTNWFRHDRGSRLLWDPT